MRLRFISLFILTFFVTGLSFAKADVEWLNTSIDFGRVFESDGLCKGEFKFVNKGKSPVEIRDVKVSCGCTTTLFTIGKILKGDTAIVNVNFDPQERPGKFNKNIYVYLNDDKLPERLEIKGNVIASEETLQLFYPFSANNIYFDSLTADFGDVVKGVRKREFIDIYNGGLHEVKLEVIPDSDALSLSLGQQVLLPGEKTELTIILNSSELIWLGKKELKIQVLIEGEKIAEIMVIATILPAST